MSCGQGSLLSLLRVIAIGPGHERRSAPGGGLSPKKASDRDSSLAPVPAPGRADISRPTGRTGALESHSPGIVCSCTFDDYRISHAMCKPRCLGVGCFQSSRQNWHLIGSLLGTRHVFIC